MSENSPSPSEQNSTQATPTFAQGRVCFETRTTLSGRRWQVIERADGRFVVVRLDEDGSYTRVEAVGTEQTARRKAGVAFDLSEGGTRR